VRIAIAGAGAVGTFMAEDLVTNGHEVMLLERDLATAKRVQALLPQVDVRTVDACEINSLTSIHLDQIDVMVAATGDDEDNLVVSLLAKQEFAVPRVVARVNNPKNHWMFNQSWGVDVAVSTPHQLTAMVEEAVSTGTLVKLLQLGDGGAALEEVTLEATSPVVGKLMSEIEIPLDATVVAIVRNRKVIVPRSDTRLVEGDEVVVLATNSAERAIKALLIGGPS
jgi:trk system potassium uptake protein